MVAKAMSQAAWMWFADAGKVCMLFRKEKLVPYTVDLFEMKQENNITGRVRDVLRVSLTEEPAKRMSDYFDMVWLVQVNGRDRWA